MERLRVLITVKTYPAISTKYDELVCTAGVRDDGSFIRLYPIPFRYLDDYAKYTKYQWLTVDAVKNRRDPRPESYRPDCDSLTTDGAPIGTTDGWAERKTLVLRQASQSIEDLDRRRLLDRTSLGIIRPASVDDLLVEPTTREWSSQQRAIIQQERLFGPRRKPLTKLPFRFRYRFRCEDRTCRGHTTMIEDWEVGALYWKMLEQLGDEASAALAVREKFLNKLCGNAVDTWFFVGLHSHYPNWLVLGVFYPPKTTQQTMEF